MSLVVVVWGVAGGRCACLWCMWWVVVACWLLVCLWCRWWVVVMCWLFMVEEKKKKLRGVFDATWWPVMMASTTAPSYWLNWRFLLCAIWILVAMVVSALLIWRYEGNSRSRERESENEQEASGCTYEGEAWSTCLKSIHPFWLLAYRIVAFCAMLALILADTLVHSVGIFYFYTEWTFTLVTIYFGLGSFVSIRGCLHYCNEGYSERDKCVGPDTERGSHVAPTPEANEHTPGSSRSSNHSNELKCKIATALGYAMQIMFQICAGSVALTDSVFWFIIYPFLTSKDYKLNFLIVSMHSVNAVFLLGDTMLNALRFPYFRIGYFVLWTCIFVIFQWIFHAFISMRWPYPFLDLSSPYAPIWYLAVGLLHLPCFGIFTLVFKIKHYFLSRLTP